MFFGQLLEYYFSYKYPLYALFLLIMDFLNRAERYAEARGDELWFKNLYTHFRQYNGVTDSVWKTLSYLYSNETADLLEYQ